jgi:hypothetical protein
MKLLVDPTVKRALKICAGELDALDADWALAGATAMQAGGMRARRETSIFSSVTTPATIC